MKVVALKIQYAQSVAKIAQTVWKCAPEFVVGQIKGMKRTKFADQW